ncbi:calcium-responsive transcription factor-like [Saccostrea echinata]|uniref:calcium-responsive transcription factor-like n=1 Tax=Saccostrea echinata TaxID=191078 RepID=UPI002A8138F9|nr:calcium-responsive transcription factor-like [Saccostrea echinata]
MVDCLDMVSSTSEVINTVTMVSGTEADDIITIDPTLKDDLNDETIVDTETGLAITSMSPSLANPTIQGLLSSPAGLTLPSGQLLTTTDGIQIIAVNGTNDITREGQIWQVVHPDMATIIAVNADQTFEIEPKEEDKLGDTDMQDTESCRSGTGSVDEGMPDNADVLPPDTPLWAQRMNKCQKIGDYYRGYVDSEVDLDLLLTYHKQQTQSFWGTRQSPCPAKPSTRLMWRSQYVPFDGVPFMNLGSRAVVMECQFGPRRRGNAKNTSTEYKQTCPARIYIKKVKKFPEFAVDFNQDKKSLKAAMDNAFHQLKVLGTNDIGKELYYVQLPIEKAHEFHGELQLNTAEAPTTSLPDPESTKERLDPRVRQKIRELVAAGETSVYAVRKQLRTYVSKVLYLGTEVPERHDLTLFPTVNDLKNQIHQAMVDVENGTLAVTTPQVNVEIVGQSSASQTTEFSSVVDGSVWSSDGVEPVPETVTVTLTQKPGDDGHHVISRIETHLSDGSTRISTHLTPETAQLLSRLHPNMFPAGCLLPSSDPNESQQSLIESKTDDFPLKEDSSDTLCISAIPPSSTQSPPMLDSAETHDIESLAVIVNSDECGSQTMMVSIDNGNLDNASDPPSIVHHAEEEDTSIENQLNCVGVSMAADSEIILSDTPVSEFQPITDS